MATLQGSPKKLPDGSWGARVKGSAKIGDAVSVTARSGKSWTITVAQVLPGGLVSSKGAKASTAQKSRGGKCGSCDRRSRILSDAWDDSNISGRACPTCIRSGDLSFA